MDENNEDPQKIIDQCETRIFSNVVYTAEKGGKPVSLLAIPGRDSYSLILQAAQKLRSSRIVVSQSARVSLSKQIDDVIRAWNELKAPKNAVTVEIVPDQPSQRHFEFNWGKSRKRIDVLRRIM